MHQMTVRLIHIDNDSLTPSFHLQYHIHVLNEFNSQLSAFGAEDDPAAHWCTVLKLEPCLQRIVDYMIFEIDTKLAQ